MSLVVPHKFGTAKDWNFFFLLTNLGDFSWTAEKTVNFILRPSYSRLAVCSLSIKELLRIGRYLSSRGPIRCVV